MGGKRIEKRGKERRKESEKMDKRQHLMMILTIVTMIKIITVKQNSKIKQQSKE